MNAVDLNGFREALLKEEFLSLRKQALAALAEIEERAELARDVGAWDAEISRAFGRVTEELVRRARELHATVQGAGPA